MSGKMHPALLCAIFGALLAPVQALADMGKAPVTAQSTYLSIEGGYLYQDGGDVNGYGITPAPGTTLDVLVSPDSGWFAGGMVGYASQAPIVSGLPFTRVEGYLLFGRTSDSVSDASPPLTDISLKSVDGLTNVTGGSSGRTSVDRDIAEGGFRLESDQALDATRSLTWVFQPFVRNSDEDTQTSVSGCCVLHRNGDVDTWMFGALVAVEPEFWLTPGVAFVGRLGVGLYGYDADGKFKSFSTGLPSPDPFAAAASDSESSVGFRGQLGAGLKFKLGAASFLETFAEADYFSDVGTAHFSNSNPTDATASHVEADDLWELRVGGRLTVGLGQ